MNGTHGSHGSRCARDPSTAAHRSRASDVSTGERISRRETKIRGSGRFTYLFALDSYWTLDGAVGGSGAEIINHCCDPNLRTIILRGHILYMSKRAIRPGEELTVDYRFSDDIERVKCCCGAKNCRGEINFKES